MTPPACAVTTGCPIRKSPDQSLFDDSPGLIAACHVLLRLSTPRHPPCTLSSLTTFMNPSLQSSRLSACVFTPDKTTRPTKTCYSNLTMPNLFSCQRTNKQPGYPPTSTHLKPKNTTTIPIIPANITTNLNTSQTLVAPPKRPGSSCRPQCGQ